MNIWYTQKYIFLKAHSTKIPLVPWLNQMIQGGQIIQGVTLKISCIFVNLSTLFYIAMIISMESKENISLSKGHYLGLLNQDEIYLPWAKIQGDRKKNNEFNGLVCFWSNINFLVCIILLFKDEFLCRL